MSDNSDHSDIEMKISVTPIDIIKTESIVSNNLLSQKSKKTYDKFYNQFMEWRCKNNITSYSEDVLFAYFEELSIKMKSPSLWTHYSILKSTLNINHQINIANYSKLYTLLKEKSEGYKGKKAKTFTSEEIKTFINEAPDEKYLLTKVVMIFGIMGACRRHELHNIKLTDVNEYKSLLLITIQNTKKTKNCRKFTVTGSYFDICKRYIDLRPKNCTSSSFFLNYYNGRCTVQNIGINKFGNMGKQIATYLNLPEPHLYTGHCFRRSSAKVSVDADGDITTRERYGGCKSSDVDETDETYILGP